MTDDPLPPTTQERDAASVPDSSTEAMPTPIPTQTLTPARIALNVAGFAIGVGLITWCVIRAMRVDVMGSLQGASTTHLVMLIVCTVVSVLTNGTLFWTMIQPVQRIPFWDVQLINGVVNLFNYAPVRLGMITRIAHHRRVDRMDYRFLVAWYAGVAAILLMVLCAIVVATIVRPDVDLWWGVALVVLLTIGTCIIWFVASHDHLTTRLKGAEKVLSHPDRLIQGVILRLVDMLAFGGRLYLACLILGIDLAPRDIVYLTIISMIAALAPLVTFGLREWAVAFFGPFLTDTTLVDEYYAAVLVDRAAEVVVFVPFGILAVIWMVRRWRRA